VEFKNILFPRRILGAERSYRTIRERNWPDSSLARVHLIARGGAPCVFRARNAFHSADALDGDEKARQLSTGGNGARRFRRSECYAPWSVKAMRLPR